MTFLTQLQDDPILFTATISILGLMVGSFLNVVIYRLPEMMKRSWLLQCAELRGETLPHQEKFNLMVPRSACVHCGHKITALENIPIISYVVLRGCCVQCKKPISLRYPLVEILTAIISGLVAWHFGASFLALAALIFVWSLIALAMIDLDTQLLPDDITLPLIWLGILVNLSSSGFTDINSAVIGAIVGYLSLWSIYWCFKLLTGKEGMGYGDFKLLAAIGAWLGWTMLPLVIIFSSLIGAFVGISLILKSRHDKNNPMPFGPYLAGGGLIALFAGEKINQLYLGFL